MREDERIKKDIALFEESINELDELDGEGCEGRGRMVSRDLEVVELAIAYCKDARYYLAKGDLFTAFGCINYAHGLIDGIKWLLSTEGDRNRDPDDKRHCYPCNSD